MHGFDRLWGRNPNLPRDEKHQLTGETLQRFDKIYDEWILVRGYGQPGSIAGFHRFNPSWENALVDMGMSPFHPDLALAPDCYRRDCPLSCPNNEKAEAKLRRVMDQYAALANTWEDRFSERREQVILIFLLLPHIKTFLDFHDPQYLSILHSNTYAK